MPDPQQRVRGLRPWLALALLTLAVPAAGQVPSLVDGTQFPFPGSFANPPSAPSAARALADAWLGDSPYSNPAAPAEFSVEVWPMVMHVGRQDLRADNRNLDETSAFFGGGGAAVGVGNGRIGAWLYGWRPEARFEEVAYTRGTGTDPSAQPAIIRARLEARETRVGAGVTGALGPLRLGAAVERTLRDDRYLRIEQSGDPAAGTRELTFDGDATGAQFGLRWQSGPEPRGRLEIGVAARWLPELEVSGEEVDALATGSTTTTAVATREAGWEGGLSAAWGASEAFRLLAGVGGRTEQEWDGFGVTAGAMLHWALAVDYHDPGDPWGVHAGVGRDTQDGAPEESASVVGIGADWTTGPLSITASVMRRGLHRDGAPTSWEDRYLAGLRYAFR